MEIVELEMEALLEARDIYTTRRPFFSACGVGGESGGGSNFQAVITRHRCQFRNALLAAWGPYRTRRIEQSIHSFIFENLYPELRNNQFTHFT